MLKVSLGFAVFKRKERRKGGRKEDMGEEKEEEGGDGRGVLYIKHLYL